MKKIFISKTLVCSALLFSSFHLLAQITIVSQPKEKIVGPVELANPTRLTPSMSNHKVFARRPDSLTEVGLRPLAKTYKPKINVAQEPVQNVILNIIPRNIPLYVANDVNLKTPVAWKSKTDETWIDQLERFSTYNNFASTIDWSNQLIEISNRDDLLMEKSVDTNVKDASGQKYVIRKVENDFSKIKESGFIIKNGKAINLSEGGTNGQ